MRPRPHPYRVSDETGFITVGPAERRSVQLPGEDETASVNLKEELLLHQRLFQDQGYGWPDLWITELGWPAHNDTSGPAYVTLSEQAEYLRQTYELARDDTEMRFLKGIFWFCDFDWATDPNEPVAQNEFGFFGLGWADYKWKPAAKLFQRLSGEAKRQTVR